MRRSAIAALSLVVLLPTIAFAGSKAFVVVEEDAGVPAGSLPAVRRILQVELQANGIEVVDPPGMDRPRPTADLVKSAASDAGAGAVYSLSIYPLGTKLYVELRELDAGMNVRAQRNLQAQNVEELDLVLPRLVRAIVTREPVEQTVQIETVTAKEGRDWGKKPGESGWGIGILAGFDAGRPVGFDFRWLYEMEHVRLNVGIGGMGAAEDESAFNVFRLSTGVSYLFSTGEVSPYAGADLAYLDLEDAAGTGKGLGIIPHVGVELFRLHRARVFFEAGVMLPFFRLSRDIAPGDSSTYKAVGFGEFAVAW